MQDYKSYRWFFTSSGNLVISGKNKQQNETLVSEFIEKPNIIVHTLEPGSPFSIIQDPPSKKDIEETAIFCACFSHQWKQKKKKAEVHIFSGSDVKKTRAMKIGTFGVSSFKAKNVELKLKLAIQKQTLRAIPLSALSEKDLGIILSPGNISKDKIIEIIKQKFDKHYSFKEQEIEQAIPSGGFSIK